MNVKDYCLIFPFSRVNANAISVLLAAIDLHPTLQDLTIFLPNFKNNPNEIVSQIYDFDNIIVAFSVFSTQLDKVREKSNQYREFFKDKNLIILSGGPHAVGNPLSMLNNGSDIICTGEGEIVITELITHIIDCDDVYGNLSSIRGIAYLKNNKMIKTGKSRSVNLNDFPPFSSKRNLIRPIEITRGCAWKCRFCQTRNKKTPVKHRSIDSILKYVRITVEHFKERRPDIRFISPNALSYGSNDGKNVNLKKVEQLLKGIRNIIGEDGKIYFGSFPSEVRPETISPETVSLLRKYTNVTKIIIGGQSGSDKVLSIAQRGHTRKETERAVKLLIDAGFNVDVDIIFGLPREEEEDVQLTVKHMELLTSIGATIHSHTFMPLVGTPFANKNAGTVHPLYLHLISDLQNDRKLTGSHVKQAKEAKIMADRREREKY